MPGWSCRSRGRVIRSGRRAFSKSRGRRWVTCPLRVGPRWASWRFHSGFCTALLYHHTSLVLSRHLSVDPSFLIKFSNLLPSLLFSTSIEFDIPHYTRVLAAFETIDLICWCGIGGCGRLPWCLGFRHRGRLRFIWILSITVCFWRECPFAMRFETILFSSHFLFLWM